MLKPLPAETPAPLRKTKQNKAKQKRKARSPRTESAAGQNPSSHPYFSNTYPLAAVAEDDDQQQEEEQ